MWTTLARVFGGAEPARAGDGSTVFSPFDLDVLDTAVAQRLVADTSAHGAGRRLDGFLAG